MREHTLNDFEAWLIPRVELLLGGNVVTKTLSDALGNGGAVELGGNHGGGGRSEETGLGAIT